MMLRNVLRFGSCSLALAALICFCSHASAQQGSWDITDYTVTMPSVAGTDPTSAASSNGVGYTLSPPTTYALILQPGVTGDAEVYGMRTATWYAETPVGVVGAGGTVIGASPIGVPTPVASPPNLLQVNIHAVAQGVVDAYPELNLTMSSSAKVTSNVGLYAYATGKINPNGLAPADPNAHYSDDSSTNGKGIVSGIYSYTVGYVECDYTVESGASGKGAYSYAQATVDMFVTGGEVAVD